MATAGRVRRRQPLLEAASLLVDCITVCIAGTIFLAHASFENLFIYKPLNGPANRALTQSALLREIFILSYGPPFTALQSIRYVRNSSKVINR
jgi:hypothetical protein